MALTPKPSAVPSLEHPQRLSLHEEVHARPPVALWPNERVISQAFLLDAQTRDAQKQWIAQTSARLPVTSDPLHHQSIQMLSISEAPHQIRLKWELHGEFVSITIFARQDHADARNSRESILSAVNERLSAAGAPLLSQARGERIAAIDISLEAGDFYSDAQKVAQRFDGNTVIGSVILTNQLTQLWTDFRLDDQGFVRVVLRHKGIGSRQAGRAAQRLIDIETYRMMALLALPHAKSLSEPLYSAELRLSELSEKIAQVQKDSAIDVALDADLLHGVSTLASQVEGWISANGLRFTAAEAYHEIMKRSLGELRESVIAGVQTLNEFMDRRFEPAMRTCVWTVRRLRGLSDRISRTTQILRTRIEYVNENQTQTLLASMDRRAKLQLRLQQTVEGLSVIVMTYYATGLLVYVAKGLAGVGLAVDPDMVALVAVPVIAIALFWFLSQRRKKQPIL